MINPEVGESRHSERIHADRFPTPVAWSPMCRPTAKLTVSRNVLRAAFRACIMHAYIAELLGKWGRRRATTGDKISFLLCFFVCLVSVPSLSIWSSVLLFRRDLDPG